MIGYVVYQDQSGRVAVETIADPTEESLECLEIDLKRTLTQTLGRVGDEVGTVRVEGWVPRFISGTLSIDSAVPEDVVRTLLSKGFEIGRQLSQ